MLTRSLYYGFKPLMPAGLRLVLRRWLARRALRGCGNEWPIKEAAATPPPNWSGWPEGKRFAFVLTHDVEGPLGLGRCLPLLQLEKKLGFRSSFNLIPEGRYRVPASLREQITGEGFEVGVHDLHHDGRLYSSRRRFARTAKQINQYLKAWGAVGFRSAYMLHRLDWLGDLEIEYDASTFDTDPFEPQPDGVDTIFPFCLAGRNGRPGYTELPYTLVQDSTLFLFLQEETIRLWQRKLDWVAAHGGMALVNVHPDYLCLDAQGSPGWQYPLAHYEELLRYVTSQYHGQFWHALPKDLAAWVRSHRTEAPQVLRTPAVARVATGSLAEDPRLAPAETAQAVTSLAPGGGEPLGAAPAPSAKPRVAVILYSYYALDPRPRREAETLAAEGYELEVFCLRKHAQEPRRECLNGVEICRLPIRRRRESRLLYLLQYCLFLVYALVGVTWRSWRKRYDLVHVHNMPDFLVFAGLVPRWQGAKVLLDLHDPTPEVYITKYALAPGGFWVRALSAIEQVCIRFADAVITPNLSFRSLFVSRGCPADKIQIVMNSPKPELFEAAAEPVGMAASPGPPRAFTLMYHGTLVERHGLDMAIRAVAQLRPRIPHLRFEFYGESNDYSRRMLRLVEELGLGEAVAYRGEKTLPEIAQAIARVDLGIIPNRRTPFTELNMPTRIFEYLAVGKPVLAPKTRGIQDYFSEGQILFFEPDDPDDLRRQILWAWEHPLEVRQITLEGQRIYRDHDWRAQRRTFLETVARLTPAPRPNREQAGEAREASRDGRSPTEP